MSDFIASRYSVCEEPLSGYRPTPKHMTTGKLCMYVHMCAFLCLEDICKREKGNEGEESESERGGIRDVRMIKKDYQKDYQKRTIKE